MSAAMRLGPERHYLIGAILATLAAIVAALFLVDATVERTLSQEEERAARRELSLLEAVYNEEGAAGMINAITRRAQLGDQGSVVALKDSNDKIHGGMLTAWPPEQHDDRAWGELTLTRETGHVRGAGVLALMADGSIALVGNDLSARDHVRRASLEGLALALVIVTALALSAGVALNRRARVRVAAISRTAEDVMAGRLHARVPVERERDVVDHLAVVVNQMLDRLEVTFAAMRAVTDSLAHDLRTPLNRLQGALERAAGCAQGQPVFAEIERAQGEAMRLSSTFASLIDIARAESGLSEEAMEMIDLKAMVEGMADLFGPSAEDRGQSIQVTAPELSMRAHRPLLAQALGNLIDNAIKFAPPGGVIAIDLIASADGAEIVVTDNGPGMAAERRARAGERFAFAGHEGSNGVASSGLGLSIVAATARLHKGALTLEDNHPGLRARLSLRR